MDAPLVQIERTYEVTAAVSALLIETGATHVFATVRPVKVPTVVLRCDSDELANAFKVTESGRTLTLGWEPHVAGSFYVEVHVPAQSISSLKMSSSGISTVHPGVLMRSGNVTLESAGSGKLLVQDERVQVDSLSLYQSGSGRVQVQVDGAVVALGGIKTGVSGSGEVAVVADSVASNSLKAEICGSGNTFFVVKTAMTIANHVKAAVGSSGGTNFVADAFSCSSLKNQVAGSGSIDINTHSQFSAATIESQLSGSGSIQVAGHGATGHHKIDIAGSGTVNSTISATATEVRIMGSGCANLTDLNQVSTKVFGSGRVQHLAQVHVKPPYEVVAVPAPTPVAVPEVTLTGMCWLKKVIFG